MLVRTRLVLPLFLVLACSGTEDSNHEEISSGTDSPPPSPRAEASPEATDGTPRAPEPPEGKAVAYFAGGCFWCMEGPFEAIEGVESVLSGYTDGEQPNPTYREVSGGDTGHAEAVRVLYDPATVSYEKLLETFWVNVDPTDSGGQFCDRGSQYRTGIYPVSAEQRAAAEASKAATAARLGQRIVTPITDAGAFWIAEAYHQDFYRTNASHYRRYRTGCGRDRRLRELWLDAAAH